MWSLPAFFDDVINNTDFGFDEGDWYGDPIDGITLGDKRREVVCQVFRDLSILVPAATSDDMVNIQILSEGDGSDDIVPFNAAGVGGSFYLPVSASNNSWLDPVVWKTLVSGTSEYDDLISLGFGLASGTFHGRMGIRFPSSAFCYDLDWEVDVSNTECLDLYSLALHESLHIMGIASAVGETGSSNIEDAPNQYFRYDSYLQSNLGTPLIQGDGTDYDLSFNSAVSLVDGCGSIFFVGNHTSVFLTPEIGQEVFAGDGSFAEGTSLSHFMCYAPDDPPDPNCDYSACPTVTSTDNYVMNTCARCDAVQRFPHPAEVKVLCDMGYKLSGTYGECVLPHDGIYPCQTYDVCERSCAIVGRHDWQDNAGNRYETGFELEDGTPIALEIDNFLNNDYMDGVNCCDPTELTFTGLEVIYGIGTVNVIGASSFEYIPGEGEAGFVYLRYVPFCENAAGEVSAWGTPTFVSIWVNAHLLYPCNPSSCNLICHGDFEAVTDEHARPLSFVGLGNNAGINNSPDLFPIYLPIGYNLWGSISYFCDYSVPVPEPNNAMGSNENFVGIANTSPNREGLAFTLNDVLVPDAAYNFCFNYYSGCALDFRVLLSAEPPCLFNSIGQDAGATPCLNDFEESVPPPLTEYIYTSINPLPGDIGNLAITENDGVLEWQQACETFTIPPDEDDLRYLAFFLSFDGGEHQYCYFDDFTLHRVDAPPIIVQTENAYVCSGDTEAQLTYQICLDPDGAYTSNTENLVLQLQPPDETWSVNPMGDFNAAGSATIAAGTLNLAGNPCVELTALLNMPTLPLGGPHAVELIVSPFDENHCIADESDAAAEIYVGTPDQLIIEKNITGDSPYYLPGDEVTYEIIVTYTGSGLPIQNIVVEDELPTDFLAASFTPADPALLSIDGNVIRSAPFNLLGGSQSLAYTVQLDPGLPYCETIENCAALVQAEGSCDLPTACAVIETNEFHIHAQTAGVVDDAYTVEASGTWTPGANELDVLAPTSGLGTAAAPMRINTSIVIPSGINLTIQNMHFEFGPRGRIIVEQGGNLTLDDCDLNGDPECETLWHGIQVHGPGMTANFNSTNTGHLNLRETLISNAIFGVITTKIPLLDYENIAVTMQDNYHSYITAAGIIFPELLTANFVNFSGGKVKILGDAFTPGDETAFEQCVMGIAIPSRAGIDVIENVNFLSATNHLWHPYDMLHRSEVGIHSLDNDGFMVRYCEFRNLRYGIRSNEMRRFTLRNCTFRDCTVGASSRNVFEFMDQTSRIYDNTFEACNIALQLDANSASFIRDNTVNAGTDISVYDGETSVGMYLRGSDFDLRNNFVKDVTVGLILTDNDENGALVGGNEIRETPIGIVVEGNNKGVELWCNHIIQYGEFGMVLTPYSDTGENGVLSQQGDCPPASTSPEPAANNFVPTTGSNVNIIFNSDTESLEYHDVNASGITFFAPTGIDFLPTDCLVPLGGISLYCQERDYTPLSDIELFTDDIKKNKELTEWLLKYLEAEDYTAAVALINDYYSSMTERKKMLYDYEQGNLAAAEQKLQALPDAKEEEYRFKQYYEILIDLKENTQKIYDISSEQEATLLDIANSKTKTAFRAQGLLFLAKGMEFPVHLPSINGNSAYTTFKAAMPQKTAMSFIPNIINDVAFLNHDLGNDGQAQLQIWDLNGKHAISAQLKGKGTYELNANALSQGVYFYTITQNERVICRDKMVIIK